MNTTNNPVKPAQNKGRSRKQKVFQQSRLLERPANDNSVPVIPQKPRPLILRSVA